ncbi:cyclic nucleotide-binding domain-containing protein [Sphingobacterium lumbrici]|uniref:hypothetical protein n=1 Tax=Sphingobacterium lumbrici TaxID=2559600 RepID=UPI00112B9503|nr:hypothetical protein [Sphingobacterium lumbrici]
MERLEGYFGRYGALSREILEFLQRYGKLNPYCKGEYYIDLYSIKNTCCILLDGLVSYETIQQKGKVVIEQLAVPYQYFSGTKHIYSNNGEEVAIRFLRDSTVYEIRNEHLQQGIKSYPELSNMYHILKQHYVDSVKVFLRLQNLERNIRLWYLYTHIPELEHESLTVEQLCSLLGFTNSRQYYKALDYYYSHRK